MIHTGDCLTILPTFEAESVDSIVTDPPSGIHFMSKSWDHNKGGRTEWVAWMTEVMRECYRLLKPGAYAVVWSLPRTCHWTAWAMEDAGFIIRDQLAHIFASGFPKGKAQLKPAREDWWLARKPGPLRPLAIDACRIGTQPRTTHTDGNRRTSTTPGWGMAEGELETPSGRWPSNLLLQDADLFDVANPGVVGSGAVSESNVRPPTGQDDRGIPGFVMRRVDDMARGHDDFGGYSRFFIIPKADRADREPVLRGQLPLRDAGAYEGNADIGGNRKIGARPDVPVSQRANGHPTVKPTDLMRHLIRLVTPAGGTVLDPFLGSGSTAIACEMEGFPWIGVEKEPEYVAIAEARLNGTQRGLGLDVAAPTPQRSASTGHWPKERTPGKEGWGFSGQTGLEERYDKPPEEAA